MIVNLPPNSLLFLANLSRLQTSTSQAQQQLSSGYKVQTASDAPDQISALLQLESNLNANTQTSKNLSNVKAQVDTGETSLNTAVQLVQQAVSLGAQGANTIQTAQARQALATQVQSIQQQLVGLANTAVAGRFIFSGDADGSASYQLDSASATGVDRLVTTTATRQIQGPDGQSFGVSKTAQDIFDHRNPDDTLASDNVFAAVNSLSVALTNNDTAGINTALTSLHLASSYINSQQAFYGTAQDHVNAAITSAQNQDVSFRTQISNIRDADITSATLQLTQGQADQQAALAAESKMPQKSLFDFLA
jgi:flagellar hook-associated protein 3 FlgL